MTHPSGRQGTPGLVQVADAAAVAEVRRLFREYAAWVAVDLSFQGFDREVAQLPGEYVPPKGLLLLARVDEKVAGCVAARPWGEGTCEMKRLFVRESFRGSGCGRALVERVVAWAREAGYRRILLDTLPSMGEAQGLYARLGFRDVAPYRPNPVPGARFLELALDRQISGARGTTACDLGGELDVGQTRGAPDGRREG